MDFNNAKETVAEVTSVTTMAICMNLTERISRRIVGATYRNMRNQVDKLSPEYISDATKLDTLRILNDVEDGYDSI